MSHSASEQDSSITGVTCSTSELINLKSQADSLRFPLRHRSRSQWNGGKQAMMRGRGLDFDEVRAYQPGDEIRTIDWRVTARTGDVHTKVYREEKEKPVFVLLDQSRSMFFGSQYLFKSAAACHAATLLAWAAIKHGDRFGALLFSDVRHEELKPGSGSRSVLRFIHLASEFSQQLAEQVDKPVEQENINSALQKLHHLVRPGSLVYLLSDFHDFNEEGKQALRMIARHNDVLALHVYDPLEKQLPATGKLLFTNSQGDDEALSEVHANQKKIRQDYQQAFSHRQEQLFKAMLECGVNSMSLSAASKIAQQLQTERQASRSL